MNNLEVQQIAKQTMNGNWIPFSIVVFLIGVILVMIIKNNDKKHTTTDSILKQLADIQSSHEKLLERHNVEIEHLKK